MKIFLTGATGYIGHALATQLVKNGDTVHAIVRDATKGKRLLHPAIRLFQGDITNPAAVHKAMSGCEHVYHLAAYTRLWSVNKQTFYDVNVSGTRIVLNAALQNGVRKLVYTSSCGVFGNSLKHPLSERDSRVSSFRNDYDLSKHISECMVREYVAKGLDGVIVNPSRVYGPGSTALSNPFSKIITRCLQGKIVFVPRPGNVLANYAFIDDVVQGHIAAMRYGIPGERYILGGANLTYDEVVHVFRTEIFDPRVVSLGSFVLKGIGFLNILKCRFTGIEPDLTPNMVTRITNNAALDCSKAISQLNYRITPFRQGLRATIAYNQNASHEQYLFHVGHRSQ
jgi:nucleoside-diphosphate-sugar epimerase